MNKFLRTASTQRLLGALAAVLTLVAAGSAIAVAAQGSGPVPRPERLAKAIHGALTAPKLKGISADVSFANHLISASEIQGSDPLLSGGRGHVWVAADGRFRLELYGDNGDPQVVVNKTSWWIADPTLQTVYRGSLPARGADKAETKRHKIPTVAQIQTQINRVAQHLRLSGAAPGDVGGRPAYTVTVGPKQRGGLMGKLQLAWDAIQGVPLRFAVYARDDSTPALEFAASNISYGTVDPSVFEITAPSGYKVVNVATPTGSTSQSEAKRARRHAQVMGVKAVSRQLPFKLSAPAALAGLARRSVELVGDSRHRGALLLYGQNLGGVAVIEQAVTATSARPLNLSQGSGDHQRGIALPTFAVHGTTAQELDTALGTFVRFTSGGVTYTIVGSVTPHTARAAARGL